MARRKDGLFDVLMVAPWWVSVALAGLAYIALGVALPLVDTDNPFLKGFVQGLPRAAPYIALFLLIPTPFALWHSWQRRQRLERQTGIESIRQLDWREFEQLVADSYRRRGYAVAENHTPGPDGGVDLRLTRDGALTLVQCKHWRAQKVGVKTVRELYGVMAAEQAAAGAVVCTGIYTEEAQRFARDKAIDLIDGTQVARMVEDAQAVPLTQTAPASPASVPVTCPRCGSPLVRRKARQGPRAGSEFLGCSSFPRCRHTQSIEI